MARDSLHPSPTSLGPNRPSRVLALATEALATVLSSPGGSIFQWHPGHEIGFGYVPTSLHVLDFLNERGKTYQAGVLSCVEKLNK